MRIIEILMEYCIPSEKFYDCAEEYESCIPFKIFPENWYHLRNQTTREADLNSVSRSFLQTNEFDNAIIAFNHQTWQLHWSFEPHFQS